eukprot:symbB.v1.2.018399.t1/scaffold1435.1/size118962/4
MGSAASATHVTTVGGYPQPAEKSETTSLAEDWTSTTNTPEKPIRVVAYDAEQWNASFGETCRKLKEQESGTTATTSTISWFESVAES